MIGVAKTKILITGSTGFVGSALVRYLGQRNYPLVCVSRFPARGAISIGELGPETDWRPVLRHVETIVHLASHAQNGSFAGLQRVNVLGSEKLVRQAVATGTRRIVYLSSVKVHGERTNGRPLVEQDLPSPEDAYGISKWRAEQVIRAAASGKMEVVIVRPPLIYGGGVKGNFLRLLRIVEQGIPLPLKSIKNRRSFCALDNLLSFIHCCMESRPAAGQTFFVSDDLDLSVPELVKKIAEKMNRPSRLFPCPPRLLNGSASLFDKRIYFESLCNSLQVDITAAKEKLGWKPVIDVDRALGKTVAWYKSRHAASP